MIFQWGLTDTLSAICTILCANLRFWTISRDTDTFIEVTKEELENVAVELTRTIEIDEFVDRSEIDVPIISCRTERSVTTPSVIRETIREMKKVASDAWC